MFCLNAKKRPWGLEIQGFARPFSLNKINKNTFLVCDMDLNAVVRFDYKECWFDVNFGSSGWSKKHAFGNILSEVKGFETGKVFNGPHSVLSGSDDQLFVLCYYDSTLWSLKGKTPAKKLCLDQCIGGPATITRMNENLIAVTNYGFNSIAWFDNKFNYLGRMGFDKQKGTRVFDKEKGQLLPTSSLGGFDRPHMIQSLSDKGFVIADSWNNRVVKCDYSPFELEKILNSSDSVLDKYVDEFRGLDVPVSVDVNKNGEILVCCWKNNSLVIIDEVGKRTPYNGLIDLKKPYHAVFNNGGAAIADSHNSRVLLIDDVTQLF